MKMVDHLTPFFLFYVSRSQGEYLKDYLITIDQGDKVAKILQQKNFAPGKVSSIFVSEIKSLSKLPCRVSMRKSNLPLIELILM